MAETEAAVLAAELAGQAAREWLWLLLAWDDAFRWDDTTVLPSPWSDGGAMIHELACDIAASCLRFRLYDRLLCRQAVGLDPSAVERLTEQAAEERSHLLLSEAAAYEIAARFDDLMISDFFVNYHPGSRQYERYRNGGGAGQAE